MFSDNNIDILKYWKINPRLRKITLKLSIEDFARKPLSL